MQILNPDGTMPRGVEMLVRQLLKMMNVDAELFFGQIRDIVDLLRRHVAQQDEIIQRLERIENANGVSTGSEGREGPVSR